MTYGEIETALELYIQIYATPNTEILIEEGVGEVRRWCIVSAPAFQRAWERERTDTIVWDLEWLPRALTRVFKTATPDLTALGKLQ